MQSGTKPVTLELGGDGEFHVPTILTGVTTQSPAVRDEIFGTVSTVRTFDDEDEALALAAHDKYGLAAGVHTADLGRYAYEANPRSMTGSDGIRPVRAGCRMVCCRGRAKQRMMRAPCANTRQLRFLSMLKWYSPGGHRPVANLRRQAGRRSACASCAAPDCSRRIR